MIFLAIRVLFIGFVLAGCAARIELPPREPSSAVELWKRQRIQEQEEKRWVPTLCRFSHEPREGLFSLICVMEDGEEVDYGPVA